MALTKVSPDVLDLDSGITISTADNTTQLTLTSTDADSSAGPVMEFYRNSSSPADNDAAGLIYFTGENDADEKVFYGQIYTQIKDASDGSEDASITFYTMAGGTSTETLSLVSGNVGIGAAPTLGALHVTSATNDIVTFENTSTGTTGAQLLLYHNSSSPADGDRVGALNFQGEDDGGNHTTYGGIRCLAADVSDGSEDGTLTFSTTRAGSYTEAMRINNAGKILIGSTSSSFDNNSKIALIPGSDSNFTNAGQALSLNRTGSNGVILGFYYDASSVGTISTNANSLPSDKNFKRDISDLNLGLDLVTKLKPSQYNYKIDEEGSPKMYGLIAQDLEQALEEVGIEKNSSWLLQHKPNNDEKQSDYNLDYLKLTPILINAIKELSTKVEELENKINE